MNPDFINKKSSHSATFKDTGSPTPYPKAQSTMKRALYYFALIAIITISPNLHGMEPRKIKVGAFDSYPLIFQDNDGSAKGLYVDLLNEVGQKDNIQFTFVYGTWQEGLDRLKNNELDLLTSVGYTEGRSQYMSY